MPRRPVRRRVRIGHGHNRRADSLGALRGSRGQLVGAGGYVLDGDSVAAEVDPVRDDCPRGYGRRTGGAGRALCASRTLRPALVPRDPALPAMASLLQVQRSRACVGARVDRRASGRGECVAAGADQCPGEGGRGKLDDPAVSDVEWFSLVLPSVGFSSCSVRVRGSPLVLSALRAGCRCLCLKFVASPKSDWCYQRP